MNIEAQQEACSAPAACRHEDQQDFGSRATQGIASTPRTQSKPVALVSRSGTKYQMWCCQNNHAAALPQPFFYDDLDVIDIFLRDKKASSTPTMLKLAC